MKRPDVDIVTLGCSKNLVDSERLIGMLAERGITARHDPDASLKSAPVVVINTCGFIGDAKEESINTILEYCVAKKVGITKRVIVMGCLSQRYREELEAEIPEVDSWYGKFDWSGVADELASLKKRHRAASAEPVDFAADNVGGRTVTTGHNAYIKIAEGCNRFCAFCAIPLITGRFHSRKIEDVVDEVKALTAKGVTEFNIIAQDLSSYGLDIYGEHRLAQLVTAISEVKGVKWIRLHYAYPADFPYDILPVMRDNPKVCKYLDIALQHISDPVLTNMRRHIDGEATRQLLRRIRSEVPGIHIRTTLMVGFPGEGEAEFAELLDFVREARFERMGAFAYCEEDDTYAAKNFADDIPQNVKDARLERLMALQEEISQAIQSAKVGETFEVVIDREESEYYVGRTQFDSPEVDPEVLVRKSDGASLEPGEYVRVKIEEALPFELIGSIVDDGK